MTECVTRNIFWDMDGTLYDFTPGISTEIIISEGFFLTLKPNKAAITTMTTIPTVIDNVRNFILSKHLESDCVPPANEQKIAAIYRDGIIKQINPLDAYLVPLVDSKVEYVLKRLYKNKYHTLQRNDYLIDDYNPNLEEWRQAGGCAVKWGNGTNNETSFDGPVIPHAISVEEKIALLRNIITTNEQ